MQNLNEFNDKIKAPRSCANPFAFLNVFPPSVRQSIPRQTIENETRETFKILHNKN